MMEFNGKKYETLDDISKRTGVSVNRLRALKGKVKAFSLNNKQYYEYGYEPSEHEAINAGQHIGEEYNIYRVIVAPKDKAFDIYAYFKNRGFLTSIGKYDSRWMNSWAKDNYWSVDIFHTKRSELINLEDVPKWLTHKFVTNRLTYVVTNKEDYDYLSRNKNHLHDTVFIKNKEV